MNDFRLNSNDPLVQIIRSKKIESWLDLITYISKIPYGRNANRSDSSLVITEHKGTCSSKHALLKKVADLHKQTDYQLVIGIYKMNTLNTPKIGSVLQKNKLDYIPEAHCYIRYNDETIDITTPESDFKTIQNDILIEKTITPEQVNEYKVNFHQAYIRNWIQEENILLDFEKIWNIREKCIENLSI